MKIIIEYDSSWRNSFLDGSNNAPLPSKGREFLGSMTNLKKEGHFKTCESTIDTVMGLLNRLIGDQRKLYQARSKKFEGQYFFEELEGKVSFVDKPVLTNEMTYIRNMKGSTDQNSFTGMIKVSDPILNSDYSQEFWGVLDFSFEKLCSFIVHGCSVESHLELNPLAIIDRLELLFKEKAVACEGDVNKALDVLADSFPGIEYLNNKGLVTPVSFYCSALYLQLERLSEKYDMSSARTKAGGISGISTAVPLTFIIAPSD
ncbi:MAG: hypothetical protein H7A01_01620 [Hahellaceae bacterium]|nr:hypothetical protein [Hahellaceae bacterium]MCP5212656.1 hypothetical protein [Hahellaceae bacterium]